MTTTDDLTKRIARILNGEGWTFEGVHEPGDYDECEDCRRVVDPIAARIAGEVAAHDARVRRNAAALTRWPRPCPGTDGSSTASPYPSPA